MTVGELISMDDWLDEIEVVIRKDGWWVQGYRIGKKAELHPIDLTDELLDALNLKNANDRFRSYPLKECDVVETYRANAGDKMPMTIICKDVYKTPDKIKNLTVKKFLPRHVRQLHGWNDIEHSLEITCYPPDEMPAVEEKKETVNDNQLTLSF